LKKRQVQHNCVDTGYSLQEYRSWAKGDYDLGSSMALRCKKAPLKVFSFNFSKFSAAVAQNFAQLNEKIVFKEILFASLGHKSDNLKFISQT
jgi:hypothetical protein